jgi:hypothetical protein
MSFSFFVVGFVATLRDAGSIQQRVCRPASPLLAEPGGRTVAILTRASPFPTYRNRAHGAAGSIAVEDTARHRACLACPPMTLFDALSQLAILGATSIELRDGCVVQLADPEWLFVAARPHARYVLYAREAWIDVFDVASGRLLGRACTVWSPTEGRAAAVGG